MKKLLALLLCMMLLISIVPTAAFAAVDLSPAYQARDVLYNAYGDLAGAVAFVDTVKIIRILRDDPTWSYLDPTLFLNGAVSYEGLYQIVGPIIENAYWYAGELFADDVARDILDIAVGAEVSAIDKILSVTNLTEDDMHEMFSGGPIVEFNEQQFVG